jgi:hypothetical protein
MLSSVLRSRRAVEQRYDQQFRAIFDAIRALISEDTTPRKQIGFQPPRRSSP